MLPLVAGSAPERTLIRVDLPAPLSPRSPTISLSRTVKVTSSSAWTRPKNLVMCSIRTSSSAISSRSRVVSAFEPVVEYHHPQNDRADEDVVGESRHADEHDTVPHHPQDENTEHGPDDRTASSSQRR